MWDLWEFCPMQMWVERTWLWAGERICPVGAILPYKPEEQVVASVQDKWMPGAAWRLFPRPLCCGCGTSLVQGVEGEPQHPCPLCGFW